MNWLRDLLFLGLVGGGVAVLGVGLVPPREPEYLTAYDAPVYRDPGFRGTVDRVDAAIRSEWAADTAPDLILARRLALGLMGTVPSLEEIRQFEALPPDQRLPWWLDHILADRRFDDYFAERLARSYVGTEDGPFLLYRRRRFTTWLADQLAAHRPYDEIVRDLIAGTGLWTDHPATNFVTVTSRPEEKNQPDPVRLAGRVTRAFLGLRLDCAQCHNHPFADWAQADFEGLSAFFGQTHVGFTGVYDGSGEYEVEDKKTRSAKVVPPRVPFDAELVPANGSRRARLAAWVTHPRNRYFARATVNRVWALVLGRPLIEPVDDLDPSRSLPSALDVLAADFTTNGYDLRRLIRMIASTEAFSRDSVTDHPVGEVEEKTWAVFPLTRLRPEQVAGSVLQAASVSTINAQSHVLVRLARYGQQNEFVERYGDTGEDEFDGRGGTIPQRLLLMNGKLVRERIEAGPLNTSGRVALFAPNDPAAVEAAYLAVLTRRPTPAEAAHFAASLAESTGHRDQRIEDLFWALVNSTEFSWNH